MARGHQTRFLTFQCTAGSITWIGEQWLLGLLALLVQTLEHGPRHQYLTADLELARVARGSKQIVACWRFQHQGNRAYRLDIRRHIITMNTIATCHGLRQFTIDVGQRDRQTVVFHLAAYFEILAGQTFFHTLVPVGHVLLVVGVGQREHGIFVLHLTEFLVQVAAHALRW